jgi:triacylglycerol lipase
MARNPVILVHGFFNTRSVMSRIERHLRKGGWSVHSLTMMPLDAALGIEELARQLEQFIDRTIPAGRTIDLVGFSMGGLVSRYYLQSLGGASRTARLITLATPHYGTWLAYAWNNLGVQQMRPGSAFLQDLNANVQKLQGVEVLSLWTPFDGIVLPPESGVIPIGRSLSLPVRSHISMVLDPRVLTLLEQTLS